MPTDAIEAEEPTPLPSALGWIATALLVAYTVFVHQGLASPPNGMATDWWHPTGFLRDWELVGGMIGRPRMAVLALSFPAMLVTAVVFLSTRSSVARAICLCGIVCCAIMAFYGMTRAMRIWEFFHWRGSAVILLSGIGIGITLAAPLLARSWLRLGPTGRLLSYLPFLITTLSIIRNATGTDEKLFFNFSPWPAIPVLGLDIGSYTLLGLMLGATLALTCWWSPRAHPLLRIGGLAVGAALPVLWFQQRFGQTEGGGLLLIGLASTFVIGVALITRGPERAATLQRRALHLGVGAALVALPLLSGRALSEGDYTVSRHARARVLINALADYYHEHYEYPDELSELIEAGHLPEIPQPRIGFQVYYQLGWLDPIEFDYQSLGSSYVLEFVATEWVMCSYNPPWEDFDEEEEEEEEEFEESPEDLAAATAACFEECTELCVDDCDEDDPDCVSDCDEDCTEQCELGHEALDDEETDEAWSCPDKRPELW